MQVAPTTNTGFLRPLLAFLRTQAGGGLLLIACAVVALAWANSPFGGSYEALWSTYVTVGGGPLTLRMSLLHWVNDALMAAFFLLVGLEIKREVLGGELATLRQAALPLLAAVGGMLVPAAFYVALNAGGPGAAGWGIPMATDIAFALGVLALLGSRAPLALKVFLTALAIADDLGAVLVIAVFYSHGGQPLAFVAAAVVLVALALLNRLGVRHPAPYLALGAVLWVAVLLSGVHATVAGVLLALAIPADRRTDPAGFLTQARAALAAFADHVGPDRSEPTPEQLDAVHALETSAEDLLSPLRRLEHALHAPVAYFVLPVFALANAGVAVGGGLGALLTDPVALGVVLGLVVGKPLGIFALTFLAVRLGLASRPAGVTWRHLFGVSALAGIGFTMSIFIANLAFPGDPALLDAAKVGILLGSVLSALFGAAVLARKPTAGLVESAAAG